MIRLPLVPTPGTGIFHPIFHRLFTKDFIMKHPRFLKWTALLGLLAASGTAFAASDCCAELAECCKQLLDCCL